MGEQLPAMFMLLSGAFALFLCLAGLVLIGFGLLTIQRHRSRLRAAREAQGGGADA